MKIYLENENKRKSVYDILNIFYDDSEIIFANEGDILILENKVIFNKKNYEYKDNYQLKSTLYNILVKETSYKSPWGMLTGSKPSKLLQKQSPDQIKEKYFLSDEKLNLLVDIKNEQDKLRFNKDDFNLYINIPFCPSRCDYCSYPTLIGPDHDRSTYIDTLCHEIDMIDLPTDLDSIYVGGGTPSDLSHYDFEKLLDKINERFFSFEYIFEAGREDTLDEKKLKLLSNYGVTGISLNPQTFNKEIIKSVGRAYDYNHFLKMYEKARELGFIINMDFIVGLVGESAKNFEKNFEILEKLQPDNITFHALATKSGSKYRENNKKGSIEDALIISKSIKDFTEKNYYKAYYLYRQKNIISNLENVGYQKNNTAQRYNIIINEELENVIGLGMNANTKLMNGKKYRNARNLRDYTENIENIIRDKNMMIKSN
ncbi:coproporphyrinogen dehydrogenase HemZ [Anaerococcus octavius]|uniref:coproporphyrinogen dehydrogenase HemZ n=1 Tax=Anaerococcus octavius TaxID=54007 RepID=UPI0027B8C2AA|nr:coproporphyrinogen dehydrogenase HemZ [Anaerococcus octavius]